MNITKAWIICTVALFQTVTLSIAAVQTTVATMSNPQENSSVPTSTTNYITEPPCFDKLNNCGDYGNDVCLGIFHSWAFENCKRHCGMCYTTVQNGCHDKEFEPTICSSKRDVICTDAAYTAYAEVYCQKTCNLCPGVCSYGGQTYKQDERWFDGCKFACVCEDAMIGQYKCYNLCPTYRIPEVCHWNAAPAGYCCRRPECPLYIYRLYDLIYIPDY
ncbi:unnamed protein product [Mytilus edulis]|uniref:Uncharacterized protein n=1 Tax=Mytilus edulis TaxID=6550 RepID=A0A8S3PRV7_MYTED|nr:unnamed protein product [Mytilus edulis]